MGWRDLIVKSQPREEAQATPLRGGFEDFEDFEPRYEIKSSLFIENSIQNSNPQETSSKSSKPSPLDVVPTAPTPPLRSGWLVAYRDATGRLRGGADERDHGTVARCTWTGSAWTVRLTNGDELPLRRITAVAKTDATGRILAAWEVRHCGFDGEGRKA